MRVRGNSNRPLKDARIVQLKPGRPGPSFFLVPGLGGRIEGLVELGALLQTPMPVHAIEARGLDGLSPADTKVEEMARHYLTRIHTMQTVGPYFLLGHSFGGLVAFEMARRLLDEGESVACLILLDTIVPKRYSPFLHRVNDFGKRLRGRLISLLTAPAKDRRKYLMNKLSNFLCKPYELYRLKHMKVDVIIGGIIACSVHNPKFYLGKMTFFRALLENDRAEPEIPWRSRVQELETHLAAGGHNSMLDPPNVSLLADDISACLMKASLGSVEELPEFVDPNRH
jgi:thioesterase domain-containing protein